MGGTRTLGQPCGIAWGRDCRVALEADPGYRYTRRLNAQHHRAEGGWVAYDTWEVPHSPMDVNPILNRLLKAGKVVRVGPGGKGQGALSWAWKPDASASTIDLLEAWALLPSPQDDVTE